MEQITSKDICLKCRTCCIFDKKDSYFAPIFTPNEKEGVDKLNLDFSYSFTKKGNIWQIMLEDYGEMTKCPFLDTKTWLCRIYESRPFDCKIFPYILMWDEKEENVTLGCFNGECPGLGITDEKARTDYRRRLLNEFETKEAEDLLINFPELIWKKEQYFTEDKKMHRITKLLKDTKTNNALS